jgi:predicted amidohydrolase YtcJ
LKGKAFPKLTQKQRDRFWNWRAVAVKGDRIVAVGSAQDITRLAGPSTRRIDQREIRRTGR